MRIGKPARRHGIADSDMLRAVRNAMRTVAIDDDLVMLIGPGTDGRMLEIGVLGIDSMDPRPDPRDASPAEVPQAARMR